MTREVRVRLSPDDVERLRWLREALERETGREVSGAAALRWALSYAVALEVRT